MSWLPSPEYADWWYDLSWKGLISFGAVAAFATAATVMFTMLQFWSDGVRDEKAEQRSQAMELQLSDANLRASEANRIAEGEKLARIKLEEKIRPRTLSPEQAAAMLAILKDAPKGPVFINPDWTNPEAKIFAAHIATVLEAAGFSPSKLVGDSAPLSYGKLGALFVVNIGQQQHQPAHLKPLHDALRAIGYDFLVYAEGYVPPDAVLIGISAK
jgi:hypothetical protein